VKDQIILVTKKSKIIKAPNDSDNQQKNGVELI
jgi:hypothetical protein